ncbi:hypothetical protein D104_09240 [Marinomonas profundimaris]|uniref:Uncharacterized protein n=1 Tax=Marinomonas profundimaris TaxID=1208321 RepID=W1RXS1_9GAMM|nr:hypothetical protein D104_09240 [Marinomonas profundimaris]
MLFIIKRLQSEREVEQVINAADKLNKPLKKWA